MIRRLALIAAAGALGLAGCAFQTPAGVVVVDDGGPSVVCISPGGCTAYDAFYPFLTPTPTGPPSPGGCLILRGCANAPTPLDELAGPGAPAECGRAGADVTICAGR